MPRSGTGRVYQRGNVWWINYGFRGKEYRESSRSTKKADAVTLLRKRMSEMGTGRLTGPSAERVTFEDLANAIRDDYRINGRRSVHALNAALKHLTAAFGELQALAITSDRIRSYIKARQDSGAANATIQKELAALKRAFNLAVQSGTLPSRPHIPHVKVQNVREGFLDAGDLDRVLEELPDAERAVVQFAALTGWRKSEVLSLTWAQIDFAAGTVRLAPGTTKNDEGRTFPFRVLPPLADLMQRQREHTRTVEKDRGAVIPWVFHRDGRRIIRLDGTWRSACKRAGAPGRLLHDLRRTAVRNLERAGVPRSVAMKLTGHKTEAVYRRYAIADAAALSEGVEKLARLHASATAEPRKIVALER